LRRERAREVQEKALRKQKQRRFTVTSDLRNRAPGLLGEHVEALNWSGMESAAMQLSRIRSGNGRPAGQQRGPQSTWRAHLIPPPVRPL